MTPPQQGITTQQTWAQSPAPVAPQQTQTPTPAPAATDFGSAPPPAFGDAPAVDDPDRPLRRVKK